MSLHTAHSVYREKLIEHLFVGELLKLGWLNHEADIDLLKPEIDCFGYDLVLTSNGITRFIQLKSTYIGGKTAQQKIHIDLLNKKNGSVVWICFDKNTLDLGPYRLLVPAPGSALGDEGYKVAKHAKANSEGVKLERPNIRIVPLGKFEKIDSIEEVYSVLFNK